MIAQLFIYILHEFEYLPFDDGARSYHDDGVEVADDAALSK